MVGKIFFDVQISHVDLVFLLGYKVYGLKGIGVLVVWWRKPCIWLTFLIEGGGYECGLCFGTLFVLFIVGFVEVLHIVVLEESIESKCLLVLWNRLYMGLSDQLIYIIVNGDWE